MKKFENKLTSKMNIILYLSQKQIQLIIVLMVCVIQSTKENSFHSINGLNEKIDKSLIGKCVDSFCKCFVNCFNEYKDSINTNQLSLNCYNINHFKQIENTISTINKNKTIYGKIFTQLELKKVQIFKSDSKSIIDSIKLFNTSVETINISETLLTQMPNNLFKHLINLKHLNLSNNNLTEFDSNSLLSSNNRLITLDLSHNQLNSINLMNLNALEMLSISDNHLKTIKEFDIFKRNHKIKSLLIENNEWNCNQELNWLLNYTINYSNRDQMRCSHPEIAKGMSFSHRLSALQTPICLQCECLLRNKDVMSVNCSDKHLKSLPNHLPSFIPTKIVRLDNNDIKNMSLDLVALNDWRNVTYLHLNNNTIDSFVGLEGTKLLKNLVALHMAYNRLREIPPYILEQLSHLDELYLSENPWNCDCKTTVFQGWLQQHFKIVKDVDNIRCAANPNTNIKPKNGVYSVHTNHKFSNRVLLRIPKSELCPQPNEPIEVFDIINGLLASLILIIIFKLIYDYFWQKRTGKLPRFFKLNIY